MIPHILNTDSRCVYPGEYRPLANSAKALLPDLQQLHEGEAKPLVNIVEMPDAYIIELAAPGLKSSDFQIGINGNVLTISFLDTNGQHSKKTYRQHEFNFCYCKKDIIVPENVDAYFFSAKYSDGILWVNLPKSTKPLENRIDKIMVY